MHGAIDIGHGVTIAPIDDGDGIVWKHPRCRAWFPLWFKPDPRSTGHTRIAGSIDDLQALTIGGSLLCPKGCGVHGHIKAGKWEPC